MVGQQLELLDHNYGGEIIRQRASDGFINATVMCKAAGREYSRYRELKSTIDFFAALSLDLGLSEVQLTHRICDLIAHPSHIHVRGLQKNSVTLGPFGARVVPILTATKYDRSYWGRISGYGIKYLP